MRLQDAVKTSKKATTFVRGALGVASYAAGGPVLVGVSKGLLALTKGLDALKASEEGAALEEVEVELAPGGGGAGAAAARVVSVSVAESQKEMQELLAKADPKEKWCERTKMRPCKLLSLFGTGPPRTTVFDC